MATAPPPYRPPLPPRRSSGHLLVIAVLILALIVVGVVLALVYGARTLSRNVKIQEQQSSGNKEISIKTPLGNVNVDQGGYVDATIVGLPIYPGARQVRNNNAPRVWVNMPGIASVDVVAAHFDTPDSIAKVKDYYQSRLGGQITKLNATNSGNHIVLEIKHDNQEKVVVLKGSGDGTSITLVRVLHGAGEAN
ncbi:MAG: hypothetical protein ACRD06_06515 [Terriglobia bacterium]